MNNTLLSAFQLADILGVKPDTLRKLAADSVLPCVRRGKNNALYFNSLAVENWLAQKPVLPPPALAAQTIRADWQERFPGALLSLRSYDDAVYKPRAAKGYSLVKVSNKKLGFVFYVRFLVNGKVLPSKWSCRTDSKDEAVRFALANRERLVAAYLQRKEKSTDMFRVLAAYYAENSPLLAEAVQRGRKILDATRAVYRSLIVNSFIPFLRRRKIKSFADITPPVIADFQTSLLGKGLKPRTVNWHLAGLSSAFAHLVIKGILPVNAFDAVKRLPVNDDARRGCYEIDKLNGAFNAAWDDERSYLLNMLVYATGMRNGEIERIRLRDVVEHDGARFIDVKKSKTKYGIRLAPLHEKVYTALIKYAAGKSPDDFVFSKNGGKLCRAVYRQAYATLGQRLGVTADYLAAQDISFYGGRHFWKTLMSAEGLGANAEEYFMGHSGAGVAERYNHRDKIGLSRFAARAREAFAILDRTVFRSAD